MNETNSHRIGQALRWRLGAVMCVLALASGCGAPAPVVQGKVVSTDRSILRVQDETRPGAEPLVIDVSTAEMGKLPVDGDVVRIVYRTSGGTNRALAVMNLTQQQRTEGNTR
jgi:hypothetical protein